MLRRRRRKSSSGRSVNQVSAEEMARRVAKAKECAHDWYYKWQLVPTKKSCVDSTPANTTKESKKPVTKKPSKPKEPTESIINRSVYGGVITLDEIAKVDGVVFEDVIYNRLRSKGFIVFFTPKSHDYGADLLIDSSEGNTVAVQVKRSSNTVGIKAVQEVLGAMVFYRAVAGIVITNADFSQSAKDMAYSAGNVLLWDKEELKKNLGFE